MLVKKCSQAKQPLRAMYVECFGAQNDQTPKTPKSPKSAKKPARVVGFWGPFLGVFGVGSVYKKTTLLLERDLGRLVTWGVNRWSIKKAPNSNSCILIF